MTTEIKKLRYAFSGSIQARKLELKFRHSK